MNTTTISPEISEEEEKYILSTLVFLSPFIFYFSVRLYFAIKYKILQYYIKKKINKKNNRTVTNGQFKINFYDNKILSYKKKDCPICFEKIKKNKNTILNCNHIYCTKCLETWIFRRLEENLPINCPICREEIIFNKI